MLFKHDKFMPAHLLNNTHNSPTAGDLSGSNHAIVISVRFAGQKNKGLRVHTYPKGKCRVKKNVERPDPVVAHHYHAIRYLPKWLLSPDKRRCLPCAELLVV